MSIITEVTVPDIGDFKNIPVIEILVKPGDIVRADDPLVTLESDKATLEVPSPAAGRVVELVVALGATVSQGSPLLRLEAEAKAEELAATALPAPVVAVIPPSGTPDDLSPPTPAILAVAPHADTFQPAPAPVAHASPSVRAFARELGLDVARVAGTGPKGRILRDDVLAHIKTMVQTAESRGGGKGLGIDLVPWPQVDFAKFGQIERAPLSRVRKISGPALARNWVMIPHVTNFDEADVTDIEEFRQSINREKAEGEAKVSMLAFLIKASAETLKAFPEFNASLDGEELVLKRYYHLGFAADTPNGLVVPVIRDADRKGLRQIADELSSLAGQARQGKLKPADMQGGSFTISSLGGIGGTGFTPIINAPEVAILGAAKAQLKPFWDGSQFRPRLILPLSLSWDHRVVDGAAAGRFLDHLRRLLGDLRRMLL